MFQQTLTPKEAVENLMIKNPSSSILRGLKKDGLLDEILYSDDGYPKKKDSFSNSYGDNGSPSRDFVGGREKRVRSIALPKESNPKPMTSSFTRDRKIDDKFISSNFDDNIPNTSTSISYSAKGKSYDFNKKKSADVNLNNFSAGEDLDLDKYVIIMIIYYIDHVLHHINKS